MKTQLDRQALEKEADFWEKTKSALQRDEIKVCRK
jgi:hypothetical protein